jgi:hypothetical protein
MEGQINIAPKPSVNITFAKPSITISFVKPAMSVTILSKLKGDIKNDD